MTRHSNKRKSANHDEDRQHKRARPHETSLPTESRSQAETSSFISNPKQKSSKPKDDGEKKMDTRALYEAHKEEIDQWYDEYISRKSGIPQYGKVVHSKDRWFKKVDAWMNNKGIAQAPKKVNNTPKQTNNTAEESSEIKPDRIKYPGDKERVPEYPFDKLSDFETTPDGRYRCSHPFPLDKECCKRGYGAQAKKLAIKKSIDTWKRQVETLIDKKRLDERHKTWENWTKDSLMKKYQPERYQRKQEEQHKKRKAKWDAQKAKRGRAEMKEDASDESDDEEPPQSKRQKTTQPSLENQPANVEKSPARQHQDLPQPRPLSPSPEIPSQPRHKNPKETESQEHHKQPQMVQQFGGVLVEPVAARPTVQPQTQAPMPMTQVQTVQSPVGQEPSRIPEEIVSASGGIQTHPPAVNQPLQAPVQQAQPVPSAGVRQPSEGSVDELATRPGSESAYQLPAGMWDFDTIDSELDRFLNMWSDNSLDEGSVTMSTSLNVPDQTNTTLAPDMNIPDQTNVALSPDSPADERSLIMSAWLNYADRMAALPPNSPADEQLLCQTIEDCKTDWQRYCDFMDEHDGEEEL